MGTLTSELPQLHLLDKNKKVIAALLLVGVHRAQCQTRLAAAVSACREFLC